MTNKFFWSLIFFTIIGFSFFYIQSAYAVGEFGGKIGATFFCLNGVKFILIPPPSASHMGGTYLFSWGTLLYKWWQIPRPGLNVLGKATFGGCCYIPAPTGAICVPTSRTVIYMGTSK